MALKLSELRSKLKRDHPEIKGFTDAQINTELNEGSLEIAQVTECLPTNEDQTLTKDTETFALPSDFLNIDREGGVLAKILSSNTKFQRLHYRTQEELDSDYSFWRDQTAGTPHSYFIRGTNVHIFPKFSGTSVSSGLRIYYFQSPTVMTTGSDQEPFNNVSYLDPFHKTVVLYAAEVILTSIKKYGDAAAVHRLYVDRIAVMKDFMQNRLLDDFTPDMRMGLAARQFSGRRKGRF